MLKAVGDHRGTQILLIGLSDENVRRLQAQQPIMFNAAELGLPPLHVVIAAGSTEASLRTALIDGGLMEQIRLMLSTDVSDRPSPEAFAGAQRALMAAWTDLRDDPDRAEQLAAVAVTGAWNGFRGTPAAAPGQRFTCPRCGRSSSHPMDLVEGYCGACHDWTGTPTPPAGPPRPSAPRG
jgi:hypothetical protein